MLWREMLHEGGAELVVADVDQSKRELAQRLDAQWADPLSALTADVDLIAPCALGGVLNDDTVPALRCKAIAGAANNQLADDSMGDQLAGRGILYAPDFAINAGGVINIAEELRGPYDPALAKKSVERIEQTLRNVFERARRDAVAPHRAALQMARERIAAARRQ